MSLVALVQRELHAVANPETAVSMQAYMKTEMPFYGVDKPLRKPIEKACRAYFKPKTQAEFLDGVLAVWALPHREEKYIALAIARQHKRHYGAAILPVFENMIREGAWWDLVDDIIGGPVAGTLTKDRAATLAVFDRWSEDGDVWLRRGAIIGQLKARLDTDTDRLFGYCRRHVSDPSFWIRKGIGWALREYGKHDPDAVVAFLREMAPQLSNLSRREAARRLVADGTLRKDWHC